MVEADQGPKRQEQIDKFLGAALIPVAANLVFNVLSVLLEWAIKVQQSRTYAPLEFEVSNFDTSVGCAFAIVGIFSCTREVRYVRHLATVAFGLCLLILLTDLAVAASNASFLLRLVATTILDIVAFLALVWAIDKAG